MAFWLYSSGTTGSPKAAIHLHHDMIIEADLYAQATLGLGESDVSFSAAKLFFAYGLGNGLYFPLRVGGTTVMLSDRPTAEKIFETIDRFQPTVFYSVPTSYVQLLNHAETTGRTEPRPRAVVCFRGGTAPRSHLREVGGAIRCRNPRRHRLDRDSAHLYLKPSWPGGAGQHRATCAGLRSENPGRRWTRAAAAPGRHACISKGTASQRATGTSTRRPRTPSTDTGSTRGTSSSSMTTASSGTRGERTTCSKSAARPSGRPMSKACW